MFSLLRLRRALFALASMPALVMAPGAGADPAGDLRSLGRSGAASPEAIEAVLEGGLAGIDDGSAAEARPAGVRAAEAYAVAEWFRLAAGIEVDVGGASAEAHAAEALRRFRALRLDFRAEPAGWLGYLGEARVLRARGQPGRALEVLATLRNAGGVPDAVRALAEEEALEVTLTADPEAAMREAAEAGEPWVVARAAMALGRREEAAEAARRAEGAAPAFERLALLEASGEATGDERRAWAGQLVGVGREAEALAMLDAEPGLAPALRARLLMEAERWAEAAEAWEAVENDGEARWLAAVCRVRAESAGGGGDPAATRGALEAVLASEAPQSRRVLALSWWSDRSEPAAVAQRLAQEADAVAADAGLRYRLLAAQLATGSAPENAAERLASLREEAAAGPLAAAAALTRARVLAAGRGGARAGLEALQQDADLLDSNPQTAAAAARLRVDLGIAAGLVDAASASLAENPDAASPAAAITLAEALAERDHPDPAEAVRLAASAVARDPGDARLAERAAGVAASVGAWADAARLADGVDTAGARKVRAAALLELGREDEARELAAGLGGVEAASLRATFALRDGRFAEAAAEARTARASAVPGTTDWWEATLQLASGLRAAGDADAADDVLRVAAVLHPPPARGNLRARVDAARRAPSGTTPADDSR